jgi:hypothetical protein
MKDIEDNDNILDLQYLAQLPRNYNTASTTKIYLNSVTNNKLYAKLINTIVPKCHLRKLKIVLLH